jgi:hypothetical protein
LPQQQDVQGNPRLGIGSGLGCGSCLSKRSGPSRQEPTKTRSSILTLTSIRFEWLAGIIGKLSIPAYCPNLGIRKIDHCYPSYASVRGFHDRHRDGERTLVKLPATPSAFSSSRNSDSQIFRMRLVLQCSTRPSLA